MNVPLAFIREIDSSIAHSSSDRRAEMVRHLTDLYLVNVEQYSDDEIELVDDVFVRLVANIEETARALLAIRLAPMAKAPAKVLRALACDDAIDVASPVLIQSERLDDDVLVECAKSKSQEHLLAISRRKRLSEIVTDVLVERGDQQVVLSTAKNDGAKFSNTGFVSLVRRAEGDELLTRCVGSRPDLPRQLFEQLLEKASDVVRAKLQAESPHARRAVDAVVSDVTDQIWRQSFTQAPAEAAAHVFVELLNRTGQLDAAKLEAFARAGRFAETVLALATMADLPPEFVEHKVKDEQPEFLLVLAKAIGLSWPATSSILALRAGKRSAGDIEQCQSAYARLNGATAHQILGFHRARMRPGPKQQM